PIDPATADQGRHNLPGEIDIKHVETGPGSGLALPTTLPGEVRFPVFSKTEGLTEITAWIDDEDLTTEVEQRPPDNDAQDPDEPHFEFLAQWFQQLPRITMDPPGGTAGVTSCVPFTLKVRTGRGPVPRINVDVHATGPGDEIGFCTPVSGAETRLPDAEESGHDLPATHTNNEDADTRHTEGATDDAGNFVVGVTSPVGGDTTLVAWVDGEVGKDNDVQDGSESVSSGRAVSAAVSWSASPADTHVSFLNPSPYGASGTTGAGSGTQLPDAGGTTRVLTRVDSPDVVAGVEVLLSSDGKDTFQTLGHAERVGTTDVYSLEWPVALNDGSYALRARVIGTPEVSADINVPVGAGSVASAPNPAFETVRLTHPLAGSFAQFRGASTDIDGIASAGAEGVDLFYTKVPAKDTPRAADWLFCGYAGLDGTGTAPQSLSATCSLQGADQPHQVTGVAAITYDCAIAGCDANPNPPPPPQPPSPLPGVTLSRAPGQKDTGDSVRVLGIEAHPLLAIDPAEAEDFIGACRRVEVALEDQTGQSIPDANIDFHLSGPGGTAFCDPGGASPWRLPDEGDHQMFGEPTEPPSDAYHDELGAHINHIETESLRGGSLVLGITAIEAGDGLLSAWVDRDDDDVQDGDEPSDQMTMHWVTLRGCTIVGTEASDVLDGTPGKDRICGLGGDDVIHGLNGADIIFGGPGNDTLVGGKGRDLLRGGRGVDVLRGGPGYDRCRGGRGPDEISGCGPRTPTHARVAL
ncbi:MAG: calcium-binding protein, partial [Actinomycetota bacterium]